MDQVQVQGFYSKIILNWYDALVCGETNEERFSYFLKQVHKYYEVQVLFDNRLTPAFKENFDKSLFWQYDNTNINQHRELLMNIAYFLLEKEFIGFRDLQKIKLAYECLLKTRIQTYIQECQTTVIQDEIWDKIFGNIDCRELMDYLEQYQDQFDSKKIRIKLTQLLSNNQLLSKQYQIKKKLKKKKHILENKAQSSSLKLKSDKIQYLQNLMQNLQQQLSKRIPQIIKFDLFGSLRSGFALDHDFDLDISIKITQQKFFYNTRQELYRNQASKLLQKVKNQMDQFQGLQKSCLLDKPNIPIPFIKINVKQVQEMKGLNKIDITFENDTAVENSKFLEKYSRNKQILSFCILIKLWAKKNRIINSKTPMEGLSSYAVILMCLYFLMQSKQIHFAKQSHDKTISTNIGQNIELKDSLGNNIYNFLRFYSQEGEFRKEKKAVCLTKYYDKSVFKYDENIVINVFDVFEKCNAGRLKIDKKRKVYKEIDKALQHIVKGNIEMLFEDDQ